MNQENNFLVVPASGGKSIVGVSYCHIAEARRRDSANNGADIVPSQTAVYYLGAKTGKSLELSDFYVPHPALGYEFVSFEKDPPILVVFKKADYPNPFDAVHQASSIYYDREIKLTSTVDNVYAKVPEREQG